MTPPDVVSVATLRDRLTALEARVAQLEMQQRNDRRRAELEQRDAASAQRIAERQAARDA